MSEKVKHRGKMLLLLQLQLAVRTFSICGSVCETQNNVVQTQTIINTYGYSILLIMITGGMTA